MHPLTYRSLIFYLISVFPQLFYVLYYYQSTLKSGYEIIFFVLLPCYKTCIEVWCNSSLRNSKKWCESKMKWALKWTIGWSFVYLASSYFSFLNLRVFLVLTIFMLFSCVFAVGEYLSKVDSACLVKNANEYIYNQIGIAVIYLLIRIALIMAFGKWIEVDNGVVMFHVMSGLIFPIACYDLYVVSSGKVLWNYKEKRVPVSHGKNASNSITDCQICNLEYTEKYPPRILKGCGHTFCESCVENLFPLDTDKVHCPTCQLVTVIPDRDVFNAQVNYLLGIRLSGEEIPNVLECYKCYNPLNTYTRVPRVLTGCGHTVCQECLLSISEPQDSPLELQCPLCKELTALPDGSVNNLPRNYAVYETIDDFEIRHYVLC